MVDNQTKISKIYNKYHCVEVLRIRSYSGPHFSSFRLNIERYFVSLCIQSKCRKTRTRITPNTDTFYAVHFVNIANNLGIFTEKESATFTENNLSEGEVAFKKYKNHAGTNAITERMKKLGNFTFSFNFILHEDTVKKLNKLKSK